MASMGGPLLFGYCLDIFLYGVLTIQTYLYYLAFPQDRTTTKAVVYFVYIIGTIQTAFALRDFYTLFCTLQGNRYLEFPADFDIHAFGFMWFTVPLGSALVATVVQFFYARRIKVVSKAEKVAAVVSMLACMQLLFYGLSALVTFGPLRSQADGVAMLGVSVFIGPAMGATCDLFISIHMSLYLSKQSKTVSKNTQALVTQIVRLLLETGILTAGVAMVYAILISFLPPGLHWFLFPGLSLSKLYSNSMLVLLNNRFTISGGRNVPHLVFDTLSYHSSDLAEANTGPVVAHNNAFGRSCPGETTDEIHTIEQSAEHRQISQELEGTDSNSKTEAEEVQRSTIEALKCRVVYTKITKKASLGLSNLISRY